MEVKFHTVRIGKFRQDLFKERILKENYDSLKGRICDVLEPIESDEVIEMDIVIPRRGSQIKVILDGVNNEQLKKLLIQNFANSIYNRDYDILSEYSNNLPHFPQNI